MSVCVSVCVRVCFTLVGLDHRCVSHALGSWQ